MDVQNPHDRFFKETFGNVETAKDFLRNFLPEKLLHVIDVQTLEAQKDSYVSEDLQENHSDLLFKAHIAGEEGYIYLLFEHKSYPDRNISLQLLKYMTGIWQAKRKKANENKLPVIIPFVIYHGQAKWNVPVRFSGSLIGYEKLPAEVKSYVPDFSYLLYDLS